MLSDYFTVGVMTKPHGLRGEMKVFPRTDFASKRFSAGAKLHIRPVGGTPIAQVEVQSGRRQNQMWIVSFKGLQSIHDVERWRGMELCVPETELEPLPEGSYYIHQLVGLEVQTDDGKLLGKLTDVLTPGANDVYVVRSKQYGEVLLPAIPECVLAVDLASARMTVHLMPGLLGEEE